MTPLPPRLSSWDVFGRLQRLEDTSFTKADAKELEKERKADAKEMQEWMDKMFQVTTLLTVVSLFISLAANESFVAKFFPPRL